MWSEHSYKYKKIYKYLAKQLKLNVNPQLDNQSEKGKLTYCLKKTKQIGMKKT